VYSTCPHAIAVAFFRHSVRIVVRKIFGAIPTVAHVNQSERRTKQKTTGTGDQQHKENEMKAAFLSLACVAGLALTADSAKAGGFDVLVKFPSYGPVIRTYYPPVYTPYYPSTYTPFYPSTYSPYVAPAPVIVVRPAYPIIGYPYTPFRPYGSGVGIHLHGHGHRHHR
jgi:hypothetical protein